MLMLKLCIVGNFSGGRNFRDFHDQMPIKSWKFVPAKIYSPKNFSWQAEKAKRVAVKRCIKRHRVVTLLCHRSIELRNFYFWEKRHIRYAQFTFVTATAANGFAEFPLARKFIANSYPHALINVLAFYDRLNIECKLDFRGKIAILRAK